MKSLFFLSLPLFFPPPSLSQKGLLMSLSVSAYFYRDDDAPPVGLGMALLAASADEVLGRWQICADGDAAWTDLTSVADARQLVEPPGLLEQRTYRGPLRVQEYMKRLACNKKDVELPPGQGWNEVRRKSLLYVHLISCPSAK
jgi:hypothetical protein